MNDEIMEDCVALCWKEPYQCLERRAKREKKGFTRVGLGCLDLSNLK